MLKWAERVVWVECAGDRGVRTGGPVGSSGLLRSAGGGGGCGGGGALAGRFIFRGAILSLALSLSRSPVCLLFRCDGLLEVFVVWIMWS